MCDLPGVAIKDYYRKHEVGRLFVQDKFGPKTEMPISVYFRTERQMPELERVALAHSEGLILDIGAGAGSHTLILQEQGKRVEALEISPASCEVMKNRGVKNVCCADFFYYPFSKSYDTLLLLMNGIGLCSTLEGLKFFLERAKAILSPGGKIICDSCDIAYMYEGAGFPENYYGEMQVRYEYKNQLTNWFKWLYIDRHTLEMLATESGWEMEVLDEDENDQYLAELWLR